MANSNSGVTWTPFQNVSIRPVQAWLPLPGTKRKASTANIDDKFDPECSPAPPKQFAVDYEVASEILRDGVFYDPSIKDVKENVMTPIAEDEEMDEGSTGSRDPGDTRKVTDGGSIKMDGKECFQSVKHSMHESHLPKATSHALSMNGVSLILSNEIQETLAQKRLNADFLLHKRISDQIAQANSMALVLWKPPKIGPLDFTVKTEVVEPDTTKIWRKPCARKQAPSLPTPVHLPSLPITSDLNASQIQIIEDGDTIEMDTSP